MLQVVVKLCPKSLWCHIRGESGARLVSVPAVPFVLADPVPDAPLCQADVGLLLAGHLCCVHQSSY